MQTLFSTDGLKPRDSFKRWRETLFERLMPLEMERLDDRPFEGRMEGTRIGPMLVSRVSQGALRSETTPRAARDHERAGMAVVVLKRTGTSTCLQGDRDSVQRPGDIVVLDRRPAVVATSAGSQAVFLELPRERLESALGPTRLYTALAMRADQASASLVQTFFQELIQVRSRLDPDSAERMASIGVDLIVACIAERMAKEVPRPLHGTVVVQRAKAFVEAHLGDPTLDPPQLAAAVGVSLRRLQELFHERGQHISDWIWQRRLEAAAKRLSDPGCAHLSIGTLAYGCGFASQAHFSRRFKAQYGMAPREYRHAAFVRRP
ncbi:helix-turn-helix domain-containing protein [Methylobacterium pseudosasicola]|uniref:AraC-binding-like domain-containing protein n=1 Tax=Methylobacterium pseudosasicola TaxID=582667 RepID=A0A1I4V0Z8_9HYPH|nr:helix-turn-helix domain-containing protein [Methylobacterium pseudosasicola]SFM94680.1 AraC-binding-like domain-containing protein [Methylobacterium pseudosasicola]